MTSDLARRVREMVDPSQLVCELTDLVRSETPSQDRAASATIADELASAWRPYGSTRVEVNEGGSHLLVDIAESGHPGGAPIVLLGHSDTVWPHGTIDAELPLVVAGGQLQGPGAYDMKSGLVVMHDAVRVLRRLSLAHPPLRVLITADEEVGSASSTQLVRRVCERARAVIGFESPHPDGALKVGRLGSTRVRLGVVGRESHAALDPAGGISAIDELVDQLVAFRRGMEQIAGKYPGQVLSNVGALGGGGRSNVIPGRAHALIGLRFGGAEVQAQAMALLDALRPFRSGATLDVEVLSARPAWQPHDGDRALLAVAEDAARQAGLRITGRPAAGAGDTNTTGAMGVPTLDGMGPRGGGAHAPGEHVEIASLAERVVLLTLLLHRLAPVAEPNGQRIVGTAG
ncbi:glutamate carboxypeptidase [Propionibacterium cyclohexanicum]|uniref:Glutamate carboxypeptidase n=1 Tax=Propionibacterium cyclohexanicum TaxID=64702 RepID=A0A1H9TCG3_9ACTN|nr:M20/M25/M40 family metallo-hydrolase [Propionibacterium cyclohexanicum]SER95020.1 glutamate carboxypeptidase [Propionibacterium cyclohexanicum]